MFNPKQYRDKAAEYSELGKTAIGTNEAREFQQLEENFKTLADNEQWLLDNHQKNVNTPVTDAGSAEESAHHEEFMLRCMGAATIMQWDTLPKKLQRELFDNAGSMGQLLDTAKLRGQIARFLHKHKQGDDRTVDIAPSGGG